jgi:hypothetical protein
MTEEDQRKALHPANDNGSRTGEPLDPRILRIAEAIGRQLARERAKPPTAANDNEHSGDEGPLANSP